MKKIAILIIAMILTSCASGGKKPPHNLDNACSIKKERPAWFKAMRKAERKWGVSAPVYLATIHQESRFVAKARTPHRYSLGIIPMGRQSSAYGYSQALDGTWDEYKRAVGGFGKRRSNFADSVDFIGWYMNKSTKRLGIPKNNARNQYLAYHEGRTGYARGSYRNKGWLINVANKVQARANRYQEQLRTCRR